jgi:hypothetical protein
MNGSWLSGSGRIVLSSWLSTGWRMTADHWYPSAGALRPGSRRLMQRCGLSVVVFPHISLTVVWRNVKDLRRRLPRPAPRTCGNGILKEQLPPPAYTAVANRRCKVPCLTAHATCTVPRSTSYPTFNRVSNPAEYEPGVMASTASRCPGYLELARSPLSGRLSPTRYP